MLQQASDQQLCAARIEIQKRDTSENHRIFGNPHTWGGSLYTDFIDERMTCVHKPTGSTTCSNTGPRLYDPCGLMWIPTKNRLTPPACPKPNGGSLDYMNCPPEIVPPMEQDKWCRD